MLDENIVWKDHLKAIEKKLAKNIGSLYHAEPFLVEMSLKTIYFSYIYLFLNCTNIA